MDSQLSELRDHVIDLRTRVGEHIPGIHSNTLREVDHKLVEILDLLHDAVQTDIAKRDTDSQVPKTIQDDLTLIKGISDELAVSLHSSNVSHFQTIADWTSDEVRHFGKLLSIGFQIQRQNWIEQAKILSTGRETSFSRTAKQGYRIVAAAPPGIQKQMNKSLTNKLTEVSPAQDARESDSGSDKLEDQDMSTMVEFTDTHQEELSSPPAIGRTQSFFRPSGSDSESVQNSETVEQKKDGNEKIGSETRKKEEHTIKTEIISGEDQTDSNITSEQSENVTNEEKEPDTQRLENRQKFQNSNARRRKTFPDFRQFTDSTLSSNSTVSERSDESRGSANNSQTSDDRGAMRRFFRAITKSEKS